MGLDFFEGGFGEGMRLDMEFLRHIPLAQNFDAAGLGSVNDPFSQKCGRIHQCAVIKTPFENHEIDRSINFGEGVVKATLGEPADEGHLSALKMGAPARS